ncbi:copper homeostasis periplasmic binding protein CopC [Pseudomonas yamanorum]|nr:copper homeostasis periplasmic binding protein CopC [Pseudomonas yamanorum]
MSVLKTMGFAVALCSGWLLSTPVFAHPKLLSSIPAEGAQGAAPETIELRFSENLITQFSGAKLIMTDMPGMADSPMAVKASVSGSTDPRVMLIKPAARLATGTYKVQWRAVSSDTHPITGNVVFKVQP